MTELMSKEFLIENYVKLDKTIEEIANETKYNRKTVRKYLVKFDIKIIKKKKKKIFQIFKKCKACGENFDATPKLRFSKTGKPFKNKKRTAKFCSHKCRNTGLAIHVLHNKNCEYCEKPYMGMICSKYCSKICRDKKENQREKDKRLLFKEDNRDSKEIILPRTWTTKLISQIKNNVGKTINSFKIIEYCGVKIFNGSKANALLCECVCGDVSVYPINHILSEKSPNRSCGCQTMLRKYNIKTTEYHKYVTTLKYRSNNIKKYEIFNITGEYLIKLIEEQNFKCALSGMEICYLKDKKTASLDRIDSSKGYEIGNVQWLHKDVNLSKHIYNQNYFIEMCKKIAENN